MREVIHTLVLQGFLEQSAGEYPTLRQGTGPRLLQGEVSRAAASPPGSEGAAPKRSPRIAQGDPQLYDRLRQVRAKLSAAQNVPVYVIFSNATWTPWPPTAHHPRPAAGGARRARPTQLKVRHGVFKGSDWAVGPNERA